jgi:Recombination endonuclease VII
MKDAAERLYGGQRNFLLNLRYGIGEEDVQRMLEEQNGLCAVCERQPAEHVDHCHETKKVRGLLCFNCNGALGRFEDDVEILQRAVDYLVAHGHG